MAQFVVVSNEHGDRVFVNIEHVRKVHEQKNLKQAAIWIEGEATPVMARGDEFLKVIATLQNRLAPP